MGIDYLPPFNAQAHVIGPTAFDNSKNQGLEFLPDEFSWNDPELIQKYKGENIKADIMEPPSQYACGSCWAWSSCTVLSDRYAISTGQPNPRLGPSYMLSCMSPDDRCNGGFPYQAGLFLETLGTTNDDCYDYTWCSNSPQCVHAETNTQNLNNLIPPCHADQCVTQCKYLSQDIENEKNRTCDVRDRVRNNNPIFKAKPGSTVTLLNPLTIQKEIFARGPVVAVYRVYGDFVIGTMPKNLLPENPGWSKTNGIYVHVAGKRIYFYGKIDCQGENINASECFMGNHAVVIVGWGEDRHVPDFLSDPPQPDKEITLKYWIVRNSWGVQWNNGGYFKIAMSDVNTGVNLEVALDRPLSIGGVLFGGAITFEPNVSQRAYPLGSFPFIWVIKKNQWPTKIIRCFYQEIK